MPTLEDGTRTRDSWAGEPAFSLEDLSYGLRSMMATEQDLAFVAHLYSEWQRRKALLWQMRSPDSPVEPHRFLPAPDALAIMLDRHPMSGKKKDAGAAHDFYNLFGAMLGLTPLEPTRGGLPEMRRSGEVFHARQGRWPARFADLEFGDLPLGGLFVGAAQKQETLAATVARRKTRFQGRRKS